MGRRSISTTKSGKFMNPTDQASKTLSHSFIMILLPSSILCLFSFTSVAMLSFTHFTLIVFFTLTGKEARKRELKKVCIDSFVCVQRQEWLGIDVITSCTKIKLLSLYMYRSCIALFLWVYLGVKICEVFFCFLATIFLGTIVLTSLCLHCFTSLVSITGFYIEDEPFLVLDVSHCLVVLIP